MRLARQGPNEVEHDRKPPRLAPTQRRDIPLRELVPGDLVHLAAGDMVPADCGVLAARDLFVAQAALTGESLQAFLLALSLAVGLTPELLTMIVTTTLAQGALVLSRRQVIVKRLEDDDTDAGRGAGHAGGLGTCGGSCMALRCRAATGAGKPRDGRPAQAPSRDIPTKRIRIRTLPDLSPSLGPNRPQRATPTAQYTPNSASNAAWISA